MVTQNHVQVIFLSQYNKKYLSKRNKASENINRSVVYLKLVGFKLVSLNQDKFNDIEHGVLT